MASSLEEIKVGTPSVFCSDNHPSPGCSSGSWREGGICWFSEPPVTAVERLNNKPK